MSAQEQRWTVSPPGPDGGFAVEEVPADEVAFGLSSDGRAQWTVAPPASDGGFLVEEVPAHEVAFGLSSDGRAQWTVAPPAPDGGFLVEEVPPGAEAFGLARAHSAAEWRVAPPAADGGFAVEEVPPGEEPFSAPSALSAAPAPSPAEPPEPDAPRPEDRRRDAEYDERLTLPPLGEGEHPAALGIPEMFGILRHAVAADSGEDGYAAVLTDEAYAGDPAYAGRRFGLQWGLALFPQSSGLIGEVLRLTQSRGAQQFDELFGPDSLALVRVTGNPDPALRMDPVGEPLSSPAWIARFRSAAQNEACRAAQNEVAIERLFRPALRAALAIGLDTPRGLAMAFDRVSARGLGGGVRWLLEAAGALASAAEIGRVLSALGHADLRAFQAATGWLPASGEATAETRVALLEAARRAGAATVPSSAEVQQRLLSAASGSARRRLARLRALAALSDAPVR